MVNKGCSYSFETNCVLKHLYTLQANARVLLHATYIASRDNVADALSRGDIDGFLCGFPRTKSVTLIPPFLQVSVMVASAHVQLVPSSQGPFASLTPSISPAPSLLCPNCKVTERIFLWYRVNSPPPTTIEAPVILYLSGLASQASLQDVGSYRSGLRKFHTFCNIFSIPKALWLPASFELLHSFVLWATADPSILPSPNFPPVRLEPVSVSVTKKYLSAIRAWHIAQGWPPPLSSQDLERINWSLHGMDRLQQGKRICPPRPPVTIHMLLALKASLALLSPFDACIWVMASCAFWGMMCFDEVSVKSHRTFSAEVYITHSDISFSQDLQGKMYTYHQPKQPLLENHKPFLLLVKATSAQ
jgi:hypothetical protein